MSTEPHAKAHGTNGEPHHPDVTFEPVDVQVGTIYWYLVALGIAVVLSLIACLYIFRFTANLAQESDTPPTAAMQQMTKKMSEEKKDPASMQYPDEPRLQGVPGHTNDPQEDLRQRIAEDQKANETLSWVDQPNGIAQIPVSEAMKIIAAKGLPPIAVEKKK
jgi:hypothetical protein